MKRNIVITIARQYGSGGRTVGEMLANDLGIHYYDHELIKLASEESGINESLFLETDERCRNTGFFRKQTNVYRGELIGPESKDFTSEYNLFNFQAKSLKKLAGREPFIFVANHTHHFDGVFASAVVKKFWPYSVVETPFVPVRRSDFQG